MNEFVRSNSVDQLLQDVTQPTEFKEPQITNENPSPEVSESTENGDTTVSDEVKNEPISDEMVEAGADIAIGLFDFSQNNIFKFFLNRKKNSRMEGLLGENHKDKIDDLISQVEAGQTPSGFEPNELRALRLEKNVQEILKELPLTDQEKEALRKPLLVIMKKKGGTLPLSML